jgi:hypothetical protein
MKQKIEAAQPDTGRKPSFKLFMAICVTAILVMFLSACGSSGDDGGDTDDVSENETLISETTTMSELTIAEDEVLVAPGGYSLTMTVDGVETPMDAGSYSGDIVLTVTDEIPVTYGSLDTVYWRTAVYVEDGVYDTNKSVEAAWITGTVSDSSATDLTLTSNGENFNGIVVLGNSTYTIDDPVITFTGNGGNDFSGYGAAIVSKGNSNVTVNDAEIINTGCVRTAIFAGGDSTMTVNNSTIEVYNGTLPDDYVTNTEMGEMMEVPWQLGLVGNNRATNLLGTATANYNNTTIQAEGWGCLSTDDADGVTLNATGCTIITIESGYGAYSIGNGTVDTFDNCTVDVADMAMILCNGGEGVFTNGTTVDSGRFGVMAHGGTAYLTIEDSAFDTDDSVIQFKGTGGDISVVNSTLNPGNGIILQTMMNDDPNFGSSSVGDLDVSFTDMAADLTGDIVNAMYGTMNVTLENTDITGAITTATAASVGTISQDTYYNIGAVTNTYENTGHGMTVSLDSTSVWTIDTTSYLTGLTIASGATVTAPGGYTVSMTVNGTPTAIGAGTYSGDIVLTVN